MLSGALPFRGIVLPMDGDMYEDVLLTSPEQDRDLIAGLQSKIRPAGYIRPSQGCILYRNADGMFSIYPMPQGVKLRCFRKDPGPEQYVDVFLTTSTIPEESHGKLYEIRDFIAQTLYGRRLSEQKMITDPVGFVLNFIRSW